MKVLIIGNGFISASIILRLESEGHELLIYSRTEDYKLKHKQIVGDIFDFDVFAKALTWNPQIIIHTAWITTPGIYRDDFSNIKYAEFTTKLAKSIDYSSVEHLIVLGTCAEYGRQSGPSIAGLTELSPISLYAEQKVSAFNAVRDILQDSDIRFTWARIFYPYGPGQDQRRLIPQIIQSLRNEEPILLADISSTYDWITTRDIASAISWIILKKTPIEIDIGTSFGYTNIELLAVVERLLKTNNQLQMSQEHVFGLNEIFVAGKDSPLFVTGWSPTDTLQTGLEWTLSS